MAKSTLTVGHLSNVLQSVGPATPVHLVNIDENFVGIFTITDLVDLVFQGTPQDECYALDGAGGITATAWWLLQKLVSLASNSNLYFQVNDLDEGSHIEGLTSVRVNNDTEHMWYPLGIILEMTIWEV